MQDNTMQRSGQFAAFALRGAGQVFDMQLSAMRTIMKTQARAAAAFGWPDCSQLFDANGGDSGLREVFSNSAEQLVASTQRTGETVAEIQRSVGEVWRAQASHAAQSWRDGLDQIGQQTDTSLKQLSETTRQQAEQVQQASEALAQAGRETLRSAGEQTRQTMQDGAQRGRDAVTQATDTLRQAAESGANDDKARRNRAA